MTPMTTGIFGVATPYVWEIVESLKRANQEIRCIDNLGNADRRLPNLVTETDLNTPIVFGPSSPKARNSCATAAFQLGFLNIATVIDPTAVIASTVKISHGVYVNASVTIGSHSEVSCGVNINRTASIGHDCLIGQFSSIGPGAIFGGHVVIGQAVFIGAGAVIMPKVRIADFAIVGAGAVVTKDVAAGEVVVGNPAKFLKMNEEMAEYQQCPWH